jgi:uncharacterized membrane protein
MRKIKPLFILLTGIIILSGCKKDKDENPPAPKPKDVYIAGTEVNDNFSDGQALYWKNGEKILLPTTPNSFSEAASIFVTDDAVYVAGYDVVHGAVYWKNGTKITLGNANLSSRATGIFVSGNDVYVSGYTRLSPTSSDYIACYWRNGVTQILGIADNHSWTYAILVTGNDVYVAGYQDGSGAFKGYWKNGVPVNLNTNQFNAFVSSLFLSGNDIYAAGQNYANGRGKAAYWKNGTMVSLQDEIQNMSTEIFDVYVRDNMVYAVGMESDLSNSDYYPVYWVNGVKKLLPKIADTYLQTNCISVSGNDIYLAGYKVGTANGQLYNHKAILWKNGEPTELPHAPRLANATDIFIK